MFYRILDGTNHICQKATKGWRGREELLVCLSFRRWQVGRILCITIAVDAAGILFKYCERTALKVLLFF